MAAAVRPVTIVLPRTDVERLRILADRRGIGHVEDLVAWLVETWLAGPGAGELRQVLLSQRSTDHGPSPKKGRRTTPITRGQLMLVDETPAPF